jgi:signal transduction histidine kinase
LASGLLVDNALKYIPDGGRVAVRVAVRVRTAGGSAVVDVADTGAGIAPEHLPRLFDRFYRADAASSRAAGSTGLGLTIAKMLVDAHAGELYLASTLGAGTVASVRLPLAAQPAPVSYRLRELVTPAAPR